MIKCMMCRTVAKLYKWPYNIGLSKPLLICNKCYKSGEINRFFYLVNR